MGVGVSSSSGDFSYEPENRHGKLWTEIKLADVLVRTYSGCFFALGVIHSVSE